MAANGSQGQYLIDFPLYSLRVGAESVSVIMEDTEICRLDPCTSVEKLCLGGECSSAPDVDEGAFAFTSAETGGGRAFSWLGSSSLWAEKEYRLEVDQAGASFSVRVSGEGRVGEIRYFGGKRRGGRSGSDYEFCQYYVPTCDTFGKERNYYPSSMSYQSYMELMVPYMFVFAFRTAEIKNWLGLGLTARPGHYNFLKYDYGVEIDDRRSTFYLSTNLEGHTSVDGSWESPCIRTFAGADEFDVIAGYSRYHYDSGLCELPDQEQPPRWWLGPLMCGWCEQDSVSTPDCGAQDRASQADYTEMVRKLDVRGLKPAAIVVDDKWQDFYGTARPDPKKWPDMRGFVDKMHARGVRVVLWFRLWGGEGLEDSLRMSGEGVRPWNKSDEERYADPGNPAYREYLKETIRYLLSDEAGCMNCDGFKLDYAFWMPYGRRACSQSGQYGVELLKTLFTTIYETAKEVKSDALINASPCHPYFSCVFDQVRLHDYYGYMRNMVETMTQRRDIYQIAVPGHSYDTDGSGFNSYRDTMRYLRYAPSIGVPDIYQLSDTNAVTMSDEDWVEIRSIWQAYSERIDAMYS